MSGNIKNQIANAYVSLMMKKSIDKITVKDLVEACNISRQTFYYHFRDLMQVIEWISEQRIQAALAQSLRAPTLEEALEIFLDLAVSQHEEISRLLQSQRRDHLEKIFTNAIGEYLLGMLRHRIDPPSIKIDDLEVARSFYTYGVVGVLLDSCSLPNVNTKKLAKQLAHLLTNQQSNTSAS